MIKRFKLQVYFISLFTLFTILHPLVAYGQQQTSHTSDQHDFIQAKIIQDKGIKANPYSDYGQTFQVLDAQILEGSDTGKIVEVLYDTQKDTDIKLYSNDTVILDRVIGTTHEGQYTIVDKYRLPQSGILLFIFAIAILLIARWKGIGSILGIVISLGILFLYIVPQIINGQSPLVVICIGAMGILITTTYIAHGFSKQTTIALVSTLTALLLTILISYIAAKVAALTGYGDENARSLHLGTQHLIDMRGLLLGGIILGTLGALNDITTTQVATLFELKKVDKDISFRSLVKKGFIIAREHVVSIINTLVLAYAGSSLIVFIFIFYNASYYPLWVILNSELLNEELIRTVSGTIGLILVVPIVTFLTGYILTRNNVVSK